MNAPPGQPVQQRGLCQPERLRRPARSCPSRAHLLLITLLMFLSGWPARQRAAQPVPPAPAQPLDVPLCQLLSDPGAYNHQLVRVTGQVVRLFEVNTLEDRECRTPNKAWIELGGSEGPHEGIEVHVVEDAQLEKFKRLGFGMTRATLVCRYFSGTRHEGPDGTRRWSGYGHLGAYTLLMIQQVLAVEEDGPTPR